MKTDSKSGELKRTKKTTRNSCFDVTCVTCDSILPKHPGTLMHKEYDKEESEHITCRLEHLQWS